MDTEGMRNKPVTLHHVLCLNFCLEFLPYLPCQMGWDLAAVSGINLFPRLILALIFYHSHKSLN